MKMKKILFIASFMLIAIFAMSASVYAADMTAAEFLATVDSNNIIALTEDVTLTSKLTVPSTVEVIDLAGKTLNLKAGIVVNNSLTIYDGTITRDATFTTNSMIVVDGATANFELNGVTIDGKEVSVTHPAGKQGSALLVESGKDITLEDCKIVNHVFSFAGIVSVFDAEIVEVLGTEISNNIVKNVGTLTVTDSEHFVLHEDSVVSNNTASEAGGIHVQNTNATIAGTIEGNKTTAADGNGGGLYVFLTDELDSSGDLKTVVIEETAKIINNIAEGAGGGVYVTGPKVNAVTGYVHMMGGLISGNTAKGTPAADTLKDGGGAGVYIARGGMLIEGGTIENNTSTSGVGNGILVSNQGGNTQAGILGVTGGLIDGEVKVSADHGTAIIEGGAFTDDVSAYLDTGVASKEVDGVNYVGLESKITVEVGKNGKATVAEKAVEGQPVKITVTPNKNYELASITVKDASGAAVTIKNNTFTMPGTDVKVEVTFKEMAKDGTPATGSMNVVMLVSAVMAIATFGVLVSKKYAKNN